MLRKATNVKWWECRTNAEVYEEFKLLGNKIAARRIKLSGHCHRHPELVLWQPNQTLRKRGRPKVDFVEVLKKDAGNLTTTELCTVMEDRTVWRNPCSLVGDKIIIIIPSACILSGIQISLVLFFPNQLDLVNS